MSRKHFKQLPRKLRNFNRGQKRKAAQARKEAKKLFPRHLSGNPFCPCEDCAYDRKA